MPPHSYRPPPGIIPATGGYAAPLPAYSEGTPAFLLHVQQNQALDNRVARLRELVKVLGSKCEKMTFIWHPKEGGDKMGEWRPNYDFIALDRICDVWTEWTVGWNGMLPTQLMESRWQSGWRNAGGDTKKAAQNRTDWSRRKAVITIICELERTMRWRIETVLEFLDTEYKGRNARTFAELITKKDKTTQTQKGRDGVLAAASSWRS